MGSSLETLRAVATREGWRFDGTNKSRPNGDINGDREVTVAWVTLGGYRGKEVASHWSFDARGLNMVWVDRFDVVHPAGSSNEKQGGT